MYIYIYTWHDRFTVVLIQTEGQTEASHQEIRLTFCGGDPTIPWDQQAGPTSDKPTPLAAPRYTSIYTLDIWYQNIHLIYSHM